MSLITSLSISRQIPTTGLSSFTENIHIPFQPDLIKISNANYEVKDPTGSPDHNIHKIRSELVGGIDNVLVQLVDRVQLNEPMLFSNDKSISGSYNFDIDNGGFREGSFMMTITFIKN